MKDVMKDLHERALREAAPFLERDCWHAVEIKCLWGLLEIAYHARQEMEAEEEECREMGMAHHEAAKPAYGASTIKTM